MNQGLVVNGLIYKIIDLIGTSTSSVANVVNHAIERAGTTLKNLRWSTPKNTAHQWTD